MNQDRTEKRNPDDRRGHDAPREQRARSTDDSGRRGGSAERKPSTIETRDWRGSGVCGDRHTD
jgi:hypothetical protein